MDESGSTKVLDLALDINRTEGFPFGVLKNQASLTGKESKVTILLH